RHGRCIHMGCAGPNVARASLAAPLGLSLPPSAPRHQRWPRPLGLASFPRYGIRRLPSCAGDRADFVSEVIKGPALAGVREPEGEAAGGFGDVLGRASEGEADPAVAVERIEIAPRGYRDAGLGEHMPAECDA